MKWNLRPALAGLLFFLVVTVAGWFLRDGASLAKKEFLLIACGLVACCYAPHLLSDLLKIGRFRLAFVMLFLCALYGAHLVGNRGKVYPFAGWYMYTETAPKKEYVVFKAQLQDGKDIFFPFADFAPALPVSMLVATYRVNHLYPIADLDPQSKEYQAGYMKLHKAFLPIIDFYNGKQPTNPIVGVTGTVHRFEPNEGEPHTTAIHRQIHFSYSPSATYHAP
jgi:hypothetical protein